jgi:cytochrome c553
MRYALGLTLLVSLNAAPAFAQEPDAMVMHGRTLFAARGCSGCHAVAGTGGGAAPDLTKIGTRLDQAAARQWLREPALHKEVVHSHLLRTLTDVEVQALAAYLASLR